MTLGEVSRFALVLPRNDAYSAMNEAAEQVLKLLGRAFDHTPQRNVQTRIAAAASLAAMKLISAAHRSGVLDQRVGKALARRYLAAGCKTPPVPLHGREFLSPS